MALYLVDTTALIDLSKGFEPTTTWLQRRPEAGDDLGICPITIAEFYAGLSPVQYPDWDDFFASLIFCPITFEDSIQAGTWRS